MNTRRRYLQSTGLLSGGGEMCARFLPTPQVQDYKHSPANAENRAKSGRQMQLAHVVGTLTSSAVASPASLLAALENALEKRMKDGSGTKCVEFARYSAQHGCWLKTSQGYSQRVMFAEYEVVCSEVWSGTWPRSGIVSNGIAYQRQPLVHRISGTGCSLWATPKTDDGGTYSGIRDKKHPWTTSGLAMQVRMWPTPRADERQQQNSQDAYVALSKAVQMWPTPNSTDYKGSSQPEGRRRECDDDLPSRVAKFPTPHASCSTGPGRQGRTGGENLQTRIGGQLNADWVSILMGFPADWTVVEDGSVESQE